MVIIHVSCGLGNQMFQYAMGRAYSLDKNERLYLDIAGYRNDTFRSYGLDKLDIGKDVGIINESNLLLWLYKFKIKGILWLSRIAGGKTAPYAPVLKFGYCRTAVPVSAEMPKSWLPVKYFHGYFQNERLFTSHADVIKKELRVAREPSKRNARLLERIKAGGNTVCLHVRRGDYAGNKRWDRCGPGYYAKAVEIMKERLLDPVFYVFSEDIGYVRSLNLPGDMVYVEENNPDYEELRLMYSCKNFILSNSSFSWWAQYLCEGGAGIVIGPSRWYPDSLNDQGIMSDEWIIVDVGEAKA